MPIQTQGMVSIRKYLDLLAHEDSVSPGDSVSPAASILSGLCAGILRQIGVSVLARVPGSDLRTSLDQVSAGINATISAEAARRVEEDVRGVLASYVANQREAEQRIASETQHIVGVLNDALMVLSGGSQRSVSRLKKIQDSLHHTSRIRDPEGLRASLADAISLIREESAREEEHSERELAAFESSVIKVREQIVSNPERRLRGRDDGIQALKDGLASNKPEASMFAVAFAFGNINAIQQRYGTAPVDELFLQLVKERVQPVHAGGAVYRWSSSCVVAVFERSGDLDTLRTEVTRHCRTPLIYRMTLGIRTALLKAEVSHLEISVTSESANTVIGQLDQFGGLGSCGVR